MCFGQITGAAFMYNIIDKDMVDTAIQHISQVYDNNKQVNLYTISLIKT